MSTKYTTKQNIIKKTSKKIDIYQTPPEAFPPLHKYIPKNIQCIWEPACGKGILGQTISLVGNYKVLMTDIVHGQDFLEFVPNREYDMIITNPPFSKKDAFLTRCYELGKPFALLLPITAFEGKYRQSLYKKYGLEVILLNKRVNFILDHTDSKAGCWFSSAWFTNGLNIGSQLVFEEI